eukprot:jgi/Psemu1/66214/estExt_Genemark1.C_1870022
MREVSAITSRGSNSTSWVRTRSLQLPRVVALWSVVALLLTSSSVNASNDSDEQVCSNEATNGSCQAPAPTQSWDFLTNLSPENALIEWINKMDQGSVASEKFRIEKTEYAPSSITIDTDITARSARSKFELQPRFDFYATEDIPQGTVLMEIPKVAMIGFGEKLTEFRGNDKIEDKGQIPACMVVEQMVNEQELGVNSTLYPFLQYIFGEGNPVGKQPSNWSELGKYVFWGMMGQEGAVFTPNKHVHRHRHINVCREYKLFSKTPHTIPISTGTDREARLTFENAGYSYFVKHAWGADLIPLFDMIPHRNGVWKNIEARFVEVESGETIDVEARKDRFEPFQNTIATDDETTKALKLVVYAHRDIKAGEPLHVSYNQCVHLGCQSLQYSYNSGHFIADGGFVEDYPRRFDIEINPYEEEKFSSTILVDIDLEPETGEKTLTVLERPPINDERRYELSLLAASLDRWNALKVEVDEHTENMGAYEGDTTIAYHEAYLEFIRLLWLHRNDPVIGVNNGDDEYDELDQAAGPGTKFRGEYMACGEGEVVDNGKLLLDANVRGFYQKLEYFHEADVDNTYMKMAGWLHSSTNFRAHYHESAIHVPLQYVKDVKRVAYIGGGDNMVLEEVLKYPNLELVVGMELDQQACRSSMKYFGTTPAYHDPRVEWWYGNAAKTMQNIPDDYFGSFDLVLVDLLNDVSEGVKVAVDLSLLEAAPLLVKPDGGVISRNEDYVDRSDSSISLGKRVVAYDYWDTPRLCEVSITIGSNSIDFSKGVRYDHGVSPKLRLSPFKDTAHDGWSSYYDHSRQLNPGSNETAWKTSNPLVCDKIQRSLPKRKKEIGSGGGVLVVIEAEDVTMELNKVDSMHKMRQKIVEVAKENGLSFTDHFHDASNPNASFSIFNEGYIKVQVYPDVQYVAFDLMIWGTADQIKKSVTIQNDLVVAIGGGNTEGSTSSFRVTAGGMAMAELEGETNSLVQKALEYYCDAGDDVIDSNAKYNGDKTGSVIEEGTEDDEFFNQSIILSKILETPFSADSIPSFAVFCGTEGTEECTSHLSVAENSGMTTHAIYSCHSFEDMDGCKSTIEKSLEDIVTANGKLDGIILDRSVTLDMGKVIHKVFNNTLNQANFLERTYAVLAPIPTGESWKKELLNRFRTEIVVVSPVLKADIDIHTEERSEEWSIVWVRHFRFLQSLESSLAAIEDETDLKTTVKRVLPGSKPLKFDWRPRLIKDHEYYNPGVKEQWFGQKPLAYQYYVQMGVTPVQAPATVDEIVFVAKPEYKNWNFAEKFVKAKVLEVKDDKYVVEMMSHVLSNGTTISYGEHTAPVDRNKIRKISPAEKDRKYYLGDLVLIRCRDLITDEEIPIEYYVAFVTGFSEKGIVTRPHETDISMVADVSDESVMVLAESPEFLDFPGSFSEDKVKEAFEDAASVIGFGGGDASVRTFKTGKGVVVTLLSSLGSAVMKWDGLDTIEVNLFSQEHFDTQMTEFEAKFKSHFEHLGVFAKDVFPRGYGRVVNFQHEIGNYHPHWIEDGRKSELYDEYEYVDDDDVYEEEDE